MNFLNISLGAAYQYVAKVEQKFKPLEKGQNQGKEAIDNSLNMYENNKSTKIDKDTRKCCDFDKIPTQNTSECRGK